MSALPRSARVVRDDFEAVRSRLERDIQHELAQHKLAGLGTALLIHQRIVWVEDFGWAAAAS